LHIFYALNRQEELEELISTEKQTRERMNFYKRELENRDINYTRRFNTSSMRASSDSNIDNIGVLRVIQSSPKSTGQAKSKVDKEMQQLPARKKGRGSNNGLKKKVSKTKKTSTTTTSLPKIAKT
jgi:hypothetical protein